jgi:hypothetical protein
MRRALSLVLIAAVLLVAGPMRTADAAAPTATASTQLRTTYRGDSGFFTFIVTNVAPPSIGSVLIKSSSDSWHVSNCPSSPSGWTATLTSTGCRYNSAAGTTDNITSNGTFGLIAGTSNGSTDKPVAWKVKVDKQNTFNGGDDSSKASPSAAGALATIAHVWEIEEAVVAEAPTAPGAACPSSNKAAPAGSSRVLTICGVSHATSALTPVASASSLSGSFIQTAGTFGSGSVPAGAATLANYSATTITASETTGLTVVAAIGSATSATSPTTTLTGYVSDVTAPSLGAVNDGASTDVDVQAANGTMDANWSGFSDSGTGITSYEYNLSSAATCVADVVATSDVGTATTKTTTPGQTLSAELTYFNCVRAIDGAGNRSAFVPSDGVVIRPLSFNPASLSWNSTQTKSIIINNGGGVSCSVTFAITGSDASRFEVSTSSATVVAGGGTTITVTYTRPLIGGLSSATLVADGDATCGDATAALTGT